jgi:hypothetical protein
MAGASYIKLRSLINQNHHTSQHKSRREVEQLSDLVISNLRRLTFLCRGHLAPHAKTRRHRFTVTMKISFQFFLSLGLMSSVQAFPHGADEPNDALGFEKVEAPPVGGMRVRRRLKGSKSKKGSKGSKGHHKSGTKLCTLHSSLLLP